MNTIEVFSVRALRQLVDSGSLSLAVGENSEPSSHLPVMEVSSDDIRYWIAPDDTARSRKLVFRVTDVLEGLTRAQLRVVMDRALNFAERSSQRPFYIPHQWRAWTEGDRSAFCAASKGRIAGNPRWTAQIGLQDGDVLFWDMFAGDDRARHDLTAEEIDTGVYYAAVARWPEAVGTATTAREASTTAEPTTAITLSIPSREGQYVPLAYTDWVAADGQLTADQRTFVLRDPSYSVRLKGPAGSGKTLALELKAIREARRLLDSGARGRVLFATHSWAMAEQIADDLHGLDDLGVLSYITVLPLLEVVKELRPPARGLEILGSDSEEGREYQQLCAEMVVSEFVDSDWITYQSTCSRDFQLAIESEASGNKDGRFIDDLVNEFSVVMGGEGIQDGPRDEMKYLALQRGPWAVRVDREEDLRAIYAIYRRFLNQTRRAGQITSDQFMSTALHWFADPEWGALRAEGGFETIFVDELHLFNPQERGVLNYLGCDPSSYPRLFMSIDPLQSTSGRFGSSTVDRAIAGDQESVELHEIHRFSPQILSLVQHINNSLPTEDFGDQWGVDIRAAKSLAPDGPKPFLVSCGPLGDEVAVALSAATDGLVRCPRVALAIVDHARAGEFFEAADRMADVRGRNIVTIRTRDDLASLAYSGRGIVVGRADDLAGLQFAEVVVAGLGDADQVERFEHRRFSFMSALYLAVSRASERVSIVVDESGCGTPTVLRQAVQKGIVTTVGRRLS